MFAIEKTGHRRDKLRLVTPAMLSATDFDAVARKLGASPLRARKRGLVAARRAAQRERVETQWNGTETGNTAEPGDWIITSLSAGGSVLRDTVGSVNSYVIGAGAFAGLYRAVEGENEFGRFHAAIGTVEVLRLSGGFDIIGPWGERQIAPDGYLVRNGTQVYGNNAETFEASFEIVDPAQP
jgi:hypothetical protein